MKVVRLHVANRENLQWASEDGHVEQTYMYALSTFPSLDHSLWVAPKYCSTSTPVPTYFPTWHQYTMFFFFFIFSKLLNYQRKLRIYQEQFYWKKLGLFHQLPTFHSLPYFSRTRINPLQCFPFRFFEKDFSTYHSFNLYSVQVRLSLIPLTFVRAYAIFEEQNLVMVCYFLSSL